MSRSQLPATPTLFPYTTLFRSLRHDGSRNAAHEADRRRTQRNAGEVPLEPDRGGSHEGAMKWRAHGQPLHPRPPGAGELDEADDRADDARHHDLYAAIPAHQHD